MNKEQAFHLSHQGEILRLFTQYDISPSVFVHTNANTDRTVVQVKSQPVDETLSEGPSCMSPGILTVSCH